MPRDLEYPGREGAWSIQVRARQLWPWGRSRAIRGLAAMGGQSQALGQSPEEALSEVVRRRAVARRTMAREMATVTGRGYRRVRGSPACFPRRVREHEAGIGSLWRRQEPRTRPKNPSACLEANGRDQGCC